MYFVVMSTTIATQSSYFILSASVTPQPRLYMKIDEAKPAKMVWNSRICMDGNEVF